MTLVLLAAMTVAAAPAGKDPISRAHTYFKDGKAKYDAGDYAAAIADFRAGYALVPKPEFLLNMGQAYRQLGDIPKAHDAYTAYVKAAAPSAPEYARAKAILEDLESILAAHPPAEPEPSPPPTAPEPPPVAPPPVPKPETQAEAAVEARPAGWAFQTAAGGFVELLGHSAGAFVDAGARISSVELRARLLFGRNLGLGLVAAYRIELPAVDLRLGATGTAFPALSGYGGGPLVGAEYRVGHGVRLGVEANFQVLSIAAPYRRTDALVAAVGSFEI